MKKFIWLIIALVVIIAVVLVISSNSKKAKVEELISKADEIIANIKDGKIDDDEEAVKDLKEIYEEVLELDEDNEDAQEMLEELKGDNHSQRKMSARDAVVSGLQSIGTEIAKYYKMPSSSGGSGGTMTKDGLAGFMGWSTRTYKDTTAAAVYTLVSVRNNVAIVTGEHLTEIGYDGRNPVKATLTYTAWSDNPISISRNTN